MLFACQGKYELECCVGRYTVSVIGTVSHNPDYVIIKDHNHLFFTFIKVHFAVSEVITQKFAAFHAEGDEPVTINPLADNDFAFMEQ